MIKSKKQMFSLIGVFTFVLMLGTVTYAFFNYTRTGTANSFRVGKIYFNSEQNEPINLTNMFPIDPTEQGIMDDDTKVGTVTIDVIGDTTYENGVEYLISAVNVSNTVNNKQLPISINVTYEEAEDETIGTLDNDYFTNRNSTQTSIYKVLATDTINNDDQLVVGYIAPGQEGIDGTITIKAYLDKNRIAISDTYDGNETDNMGTTTEWVGDREVFTTNEWNSLQQNGVSFKVKVEANEGIWVEEHTAYNQIIKNVNTNTLIDFGEISSSSNGEGLYILPGTENDTYPIYYYRGAVDDNNVIFGGYCWQMVRTTDTGGIKMIYNGVATDNGTTCINFTAATRRLTSKARFSSSVTYMADIGYMKNVSWYHSATTTTNAIYGKNIEFDGTSYLVIEDTEHVASTNTTKDNYHHYSCGSNGITSCDMVRYYYYNDYYINISGGNTLEDVIYKQTGNGSQATKTKNSEYNLNAINSNIKTSIDNWFKTYLTSEIDSNNPNYSVYLEDTIYCNDRSFKTSSGNSNYPTYEESGWNPNGGNLPNHLYFGTYNRWNNNWYSTTNVPTISCPNEIDRFTVSNLNGNGNLSYPVGLLTSDEAIMAGADGNGTDYNTDYYLHTGENYWTMSPESYNRTDTNEFVVTLNGALVENITASSNGVRPVVSLKSGIEFENGGDGTPTNPYVVKYN